MSLGGYIFYLALIMLIPLWAQMRVKSTYKKFLQQPIQSGVTGAQVADFIMKQNGVHNVRIEMVDGLMSDHYDPVNKVVRLSREVYQGSTISSAAIAAHELSLIHISEPTRRS